MTDDRTPQQPAPQNDEITEDSLESVSGGGIGISTFYPILIPIGTPPFLPTIPPGSGTVREG